ncbi:SRSO17 transposase, partial [Azomonas macrocytogenes]|nr:SRSO17 transposase [Azomonas macrocytogenes]
MGHLETALRGAGKGYVLGVKGTHAVKAWIDRPWICGTAKQVAQALPPSAWRRCSTGEGSQGPRLHDWTYLELADLEASDYDPCTTGLWTRGLLIRRRLVDGELAYFSTWAPAGTALEKLA